MKHRNDVGPCGAWSSRLVSSKTFLTGQRPVAPDGEDRQEPQCLIAGDLGSKALVYANRLANGLPPFQAGDEHVLSLMTDPAATAGESIFAARVAKPNDGPVFDLGYRSATVYSREDVREFGSALARNVVGLRLAQATGELAREAEASSAVTSTGGKTRGCLQQADPAFPLPQNVRRLHVHQNA